MVDAPAQDLQVATAQTEVQPAQMPSEPARPDGGLKMTPTQTPATPAMIQPWLAALWPPSKLHMALGGGLLATLAISDSASSSENPATVNPDAGQRMAAVQGTITLGPAVAGHTLIVSAYDATGQLLARAPLNADGSYTVNISTGYTGPVLLRVSDDSDGPDYIDEATGGPRDLDGELRSVALIDSSGSATAHVTPLTELVVRKLGLGPSQSGAAGVTLGSISAEQIAAVKTMVAQALGLDGIDLMTARPEPIINANGQIDLSRADAYGRLLAALAGMEAGEGHGTDEMLQALSANINLETGTLSADGLMDLVSGARLVAKKNPAANALFGEVGQSIGLSAAQIDGIDSAWRTLLTLADGIDNDGAGLSTTQLQALGVRRVEDGAKLDGLNNVLDVKTSTAVQSRSKLQAWADTITVVLSKAAGGEATPTQDELEDLGLTDLTPGRTIDLITKIATSPDDGRDVDSLAKLQALVDVVAPTTSATNLTLGSDTGLSASDWITREAVQTLTARLSAPLLTDEKLLGSVDDGASWQDISRFVNGTTLSWTGTALGGASAVKLMVIDAAMNEGPVARQAYVLDTAPPVLPTLSSEALTREPRPLLNGAAEAGSSVTVTVGGATFSTVVGSAGTWSVNTAATPSTGRFDLGSDGLKTVAITSTDLAGNHAMTNASLRLDTAAPTAILASTTVDTTGTALVASTESGQAYLVSAQVSVTSLADIVQASADAWTSAPLTSAQTPMDLPVRGLTPGSYRLYTTDAAGNLSAPSAQALNVTRPGIDEPAGNETPAATTLLGMTLLGPVMSGHSLTVSAYAASGQLLARGALSPDGSYLLQLGSPHTGPVLLCVTDSSPAADYQDEATGAPRDLDTDLRSVIVLNGESLATAHITP